MIFWFWIWGFLGIFALFFQRAKSFRGCGIPFRGRQIPFGGKVVFFVDYIFFVYTFAALKKTKDTMQKRMSDQNANYANDANFRIIKNTSIAGIDYAGFGFCFYSHNLR